MRKTHNVNFDAENLFVLRCHKVFGCKLGSTVHLRLETLTKYTETKWIYTQSEIDFL
jgi:hypothetical protein